MSDEVGYKKTSDRKAFRAGRHQCMNCGGGSASKQFEGVPVCTGCFGIALASFERAKQQLDQILTLYRESLRRGLVEGRMHGASQTTAPVPDDLLAIFRRVMQ